MVCGHGWKLGNSVGREQEDPVYVKNNTEHWGGWRSSRVSSAGKAGRESGMGRLMCGCPSEYEGRHIPFWGLSDFMT